MRFARQLQALDTRYNKWKSQSVIFGDFRRPVRRKRVNLYYWKHGARDNVGDLLSQVVVSKMAELHGLDPDCRTRYTRRLFAIGSILEFALHGITVWGSGLRHSVLSPQGMHLDLRAVRGPLTREALIHVGHDCPEVYGDPAILLPSFYQPQPVPRPFLLVPHFLREQELMHSHPGQTISTLTSDWPGFIDAIAGARLVISGSLHGIVVAEAYGVPAVLLEAAMDRDRFKYDDYYRGTGRGSYQVASTVQEALARGGEPLPDLQAARERLMEAFPRDLWQS